MDASKSGQVSIFWVWLDKLGMAIGDNSPWSHSQFEMTWMINELTFRSFLFLSKYNNAFAKNIYIKRWIHYYIISSCPLSSYQTLQKFIFVYATHSCTVNLSTICGGNVLRVGADLHSTQFQNSMLSLSLSPLSLLVTVLVSIYPYLSQ